jgi:hypothetical protein
MADHPNLWLMPATHGFDRAEATFVGAVPTEKTFTVDAGAGEGAGLTLGLGVAAGATLALGVSVDPEAPLGVGVPSGLTSTVHVTVTMSVKNDLPYRACTFIRYASGATRVYVRTWLRGPTTTLAAGIVRALLRRLSESRALEFHHVSEACTSAVAGIEKANEREGHHSAAVPWNRTTRRRVSSVEA